MPTTKKHARKAATRNTTRECGCRQTPQRRVEHASNRAENRGGRSKACAKSCCLPVARLLDSAAAAGLPGHRVA